MKPSKKSRMVDGVIDLILGGKPGDNLRKATIRGDICVAAPIGCGGVAKEFRDERSRREYTISGFCQDCQDNMFGV